MGIHCPIYRQVLASKTLAKSLKDVLSTVVQVVNFVRGKALQHWLFKEFCEEIGSKHTVLLYLIKLRWLSRGRVLNRVVNLQRKFFLPEAGHKAAEKLENKNFLLMPYDLANIFGLLNEFNLLLQGSNANRTVCFQKVHVFMHKLSM